MNSQQYFETPVKNYLANKEELSYLAGIVDGEGSIMIVKQTQSTKKNPSYALLLTVSSTDKILCDWIQQRFGGNVIHCRSGNEKWKTAYRWQIRSWGALMILESISPFLIIKKIKADYGICFQQRRRKPGVGGITQEEIKKYEWYKKQISESRAYNGTF